MTLVDLTHPLTPAAHVPEGFPRVEQRLLATHARDGLQDTWLELSMHAGTHLDAPLHAVPDGEDIAMIALERIIGPAVAWRCPCVEPRAIDARELASAYPPLQSGDRVLIATGWERFYACADRYRVHPHLSDDAAAWLVARGATVVGIDTPTPDLAGPLRPEGFDHPVHHALLERGVLIVENLANLERVAVRRFRLLLCQIPVACSDGAPVRAIAELDD